MEAGGRVLCPAGTCRLSVQILGGVLCLLIREESFEEWGLPPLMCKSAVN